MVNTFILSDSSLNFYKFRVLTSGIDLSQFQKNPVMLYSHNLAMLPIGRWENMRIEGDQLKADAVFDENDEFAMQIKSKVEGGFIKGVSIGLKVLEKSDAPEVLLPGQTRETVTKCLLYETSIVNLPGNRNALKLSDENGLRLSDQMNDVELNGVLPLIKPHFNMKKIALALGLSENASETEILSAIEGLDREKKQIEQSNKDLAGSMKDIVLSVGEKLGVITEGNKANYEKLASTDAQTTLSLMMGNASTQTKKEEGENIRLSDVLAAVKKGQGASDQGEEKDFDWYQKNKPNVLLSMKTDDPEKYKKLYDTYINS